MYQLHSSIPQLEETPHDSDPALGDWDRSGPSRGIRFFNDRSPLESLTSCQHDVGCGGGGHMGDALIAQGREIEVVQEMLARPEQPWRDRYVQLVNEPRFEVLADRRHAAADLHILSLSTRRRSLQRLADTARDKVENRAAFHLNRRAAVMRQHKYGAVVRRVLSPPAAPGVIGPGATNRAEHVASHDPGSDALPKTRRDIVIDAGGAAGLTIDTLERAGRDKPFVQSFTTDAEGILASLVRASAVAIERNRKVMHAHTSHCLLPRQGRRPGCGFHTCDELALQLIRDPTDVFERFRIRAVFRGPGRLEQV